MIESGFSQSLFLGHVEIKYHELQEIGNPPHPIYGAAKQSWLKKRLKELRDEGNTTPMDMALNGGACEKGRYGIHAG